MGIAESLGSRFGRLFGRGDKVAPEALAGPIPLVLQTGKLQTVAHLNLIASEFNDKRFPSGCALSVWNEGTDEKNADMKEGLRKDMVVTHGGKSIAINRFDSKKEPGSYTPEVHVTVSSA